jgi:hypothetical protein
MNLLLKQARTYIWLLKDTNKEQFPFLYRHYLIQLNKIKHLIKKQTEQTKTFKFKLVA